MREPARSANGCWAMRSGGRSYWNSETSIEEIIGLRAGLRTAAGPLASCGLLNLQAETAGGDETSAGASGAEPRHHTIQSILRILTF